MHDCLSLKLLFLFGQRSSAILLAFTILFIYVKSIFSFWRSMKLYEKKKIIALLVLEFLINFDFQRHQQPKQSQNRMKVGKGSCSSPCFVLNRKYIMFCFICFPHEIFFRYVIYTPTMRYMRIFYSLVENIKCIISVPSCDLIYDRNALWWQLCIRFKLCLVQLSILEDVSMVLLKQSGFSFFI